PDGGESVTRSFASDDLAGPGNLVEVTIVGNTHWRDYSPATGQFAALSDLLRDGPLCNSDCNMRLVLDGLLDGNYEIILYNHTTEFGTLNWREFTPFDILLTDGVDTGRLAADDVIMSENASEQLTTVTISFTVVAGSPVEISLQKPGNRDHMALSGFELVRSSPPGVNGSVVTDLAAAMHDVNSSAYIRTEFEVAAGVEFARLQLRMQYDDGFVAYLNGTEIARRNAPETLDWNATATANRPVAEAIVFEQIDVSAHREAILPGQTNVLAIHGLNLSADDDDFLILPELSGSAVLSDHMQYFPLPTPGAVNESGFDGFVEDTLFSTERGIFRSAAEAFDVEITTATPDATIVFTTDGSAPQVDEAGSIVNGQAYSTPLHVDRTTTLRASAFRVGFIPANVDTHTYIFLDDVLDQSSTPPDGFPATWGGTLTDWGLDQDLDRLKLIAGDINFTLFEARNVIAESLLALPTMSIVMDVDDIFGSASGIYANTYERGIAWERPASVELIQPDGTTAFQINAGIRIQGNTSRNPDRNPKHSFRLVFREQYGDGKLNYRFFDDSPVDEFDTLVLRSNSQDAWVDYPEENRAGTFIRDQWARQTQLDMGQAAARGNWVHLYINGLYWGVYNPTERPDASFNASYFGGDKDNYDALKNNEEVIDGNGAAYRELLTLIQNDPDDFAAGYRDLSSDAAYQQVLGYVDPVNLADYMIHNMYAAAHDWPGNNYIGIDRTGDQGFRFFDWDNEHGFKSEVSVNRTLPNRRDADSPTKIHHALRSNAEYRLLFADQLHRALFNGGALYVDPDQPQWDPEHPERNVPAARFVEIAESIDPALIAESARWGDVRDQLYTPHDQLLTLRDSLLAGWFPQRSQILLDQFRAQGLYPDLAAAEFNQHGGSIAEGFQLTASAPQGEIYYTTDGSDPRVAISGEVSPTAQRFDGTLTLDASTHIKTRVLWGDTWSALDEATFLMEAPTLTLAISEIHFNPAAPPEGSPSDNDAFEFVEFFNFGSETIDLSGVRLVDGVSFDFTDSGATSLGAGQYTVVVKDMAAFAARYDIANISIAGQYSGLDDQLDNSGERITLVDRFDQIIANFKFKDGWHDLADGEGFSLTRTDPRDEDADLESRATWRPSSDLGGSPGAADRRATPEPRAVIINELLSHTDAAPGDRIELYNTTDAAIDLAGWLLSDDPLMLDKYVIPAPAVIAAGGYLLFDESQHFGNPAAAGVSETFGFSELGERAILSAADSTGLLGYRATRRFGPAQREVSFGLHVKSTGGDDFVAMQTSTFGAANARPLVGPVVINELRYRPGEDRLEFIELRNTSDAAVSLAGWSLSGVQFVFPPEAIIAADGLLIVVPVDPESFRAAESVADDVPVVGPYPGALNNGGEDVRLFMPGDIE
ncbi:MAG: lamin tail domain-containing protein, partial [Planctomycetes bacterium]|nr:lamin tail domain-containing protein [Planctomycetota bacterium]